MFTCISGNILMFMPIVYPLCSMVLGRSFPMMTSPLMPCSVAVFTAGVMLSFSSAGSLVIAMFLCHWALIGLSKIYFFNIPEDFILACSILPALCLFFNEYIKSGSRDTKPSPRTLKWFIGILCFIIGIFFCYVMAYQINLMER